jgi:FdrA protein
VAGGILLGIGTALVYPVLLGQISSMNPAGDLIDAICKAKEKVVRRGGYLTVVASICGTNEDPQGYDRQKAMLLQAGVITFSSSARAAKFCAELISSKEKKQDGK